MYNEFMNVEKVSLVESTFSNNIMDIHVQKCKKSIHNSKQILLQWFTFLPSTPIIEICIFCVYLDQYNITDQHLSLSVFHSNRFVCDSSCGPNALVLYSSSDSTFARFYVTSFSRGVLIRIKNPLRF